MIRVLTCKRNIIFLIHLVMLTESSTNTTSMLRAQGTCEVDKSEVLNKISVHEWNSNGTA
jgi:hypothetical protein